MKTYLLETDYGTHGVYFSLDRYRHNDSLAIELIDSEDNCPYARITVCIDNPFKLAHNESFVDTNNCPWAEKFIKDNELGKPAGKVWYSGFCTYPLYEFNLDKLR